MISKVNNSPSFGMAFKQEKMLGALMPLPEKTLTAYKNAAEGIHKLSEEKGADVFLTGIERAAKAVGDAADAAEPIIDSFRLTVSGKNTENIKVVSDIAANAIPETPRQVNKFFNKMRKDIGKIGILDDIAKTFGI